MHAFSQQGKKPVYRNELKGRSIYIAEALLQASDGLGCIAADRTCLGTASCDTSHHRPLLAEPWLVHQALLRWDNN